MVPYARVCSWLAHRGHCSDLSVKPGLSAGPGVGAASHSDSPEGWQQSAECRGWDDATVYRGTCSSTFVWSFRSEGLELPEVKTRLGSERSDCLYWRRQTRGRDPWAAQRWRPPPWASHARALALPGSHAQALACLSRLPGQLLSWSRLKIGMGHLSTSWEVSQFFFSLSLSESPVADVSRSCADSAEGRMSFSLFFVNIFEQLQGRCRNWEFLLFFIDFLKIQT